METSSERFHISSDGEVGGRLDGGGYYAKKQWEGVLGSPAVSPLIPALRGNEEGLSLGGEGEKQWAPLSPLSFEDGTAGDIVGRWVSPSAPPQVTTFLRSLLRGDRPAPPTLELVNSAGARDPKSGLCGWEAWITPSAPPAVQSAFSAWLLGTAFATPPPAPSTPPLLAEVGQLARREGLGSPVDIRPSQSLESSPLEQVGPEQSGIAAYSSRTEAASDSASTTSDFTFAPRLHNRGLREWVSDGSTASTAVKSSVLQWAETATNTRPPVPHHHSRSRRDPDTTSHRPYSSDERASSSKVASERTPYAPTSGPLATLVGVPFLTDSRRYVATELEAEVVSALLPEVAARLSEPRVVGLWGACGSGKSTAAAAAIRAPAVRRSFPGGIVWIAASAVLSAFDAQSTSETVALLYAAAAAVDALPSNGPPWPPLSMVAPPSRSNHQHASSPFDVSESDLRAWLGVRLRALPGHSLFVVDGVTGAEEGQKLRFSGFAGLGVSLLLIAETASAFSPPQTSDAVSKPNGVRVKEVCANSGMADRQAMALLLVAAGCRLDEVSREAAAGLVAASSRLPAELLLLGGIARGRASMQRLPCRAADLRALTSELRGPSIIDPIQFSITPTAALLRTFRLAISELRPLDEAMLFLLGATWPGRGVTFSLSLLRALWVGDGPDTLSDMNEVILFAGRLEQRGILLRQSTTATNGSGATTAEDYDGHYGSWRMHALLLGHLASELRRDGAAFAKAEARLASFQQQNVIRSQVETEASISKPANSSPIANFENKEAERLTTESTTEDRHSDLASNRTPTRSPVSVKDYFADEQQPTFALYPPSRADGAMSPATPPLLLGAGGGSPQQSTSNTRLTAISTDNDAAWREASLMPDPVRTTSTSWDSQRGAEYDRDASMADSVATAYYSDRGELLEVMEETLRSRVGEGAVSLLPPSPSKVTQLAEPSEDLHYHYHYHSSPSTAAASRSTTPTSSPARRPPPTPSSPRSPGIFNTSRLSAISSPGTWPLSPPTSPTPGRQPTDRHQTLATPLFHAQVVDRTTAAMAKLDLNHAGNHNETVAPTLLPPGDAGTSGLLESWPTSPISSPSRRRYAGNDVNLCAMSANTQRMLEVHITPYLPVWDKQPGTILEPRELSDVTRTQVFEYASGVMLEPSALPS